MSAETWIVIPKWEEFQHRDAARSSVPKWIKDHTEQLSKDAYLGLTWEQRGLLHDLRLEYARAKRRLPADTRALSRRLGLTVRKSQLDALVRAGFVELSSARQPNVVRASAERQPNAGGSPSASEASSVQDIPSGDAGLKANAASSHASKPASDRASLEERRGEEKEQRAAATLSVVQPAPHTENQEPEELAAAAHDEAPRTTDIRTVCERLRADERQVEPLARNLTTTEFTAILDTVDDRCRTGAVKNPAGLLIQLLREAQRAARKTDYQPQTIEDQIAADYRTAPPDTPLEVLHELTQRKLTRLRVPEHDWPRLLEIGAAVHANREKTTKEAA